MKIKEITTYLERIAPLTYQESYDNAGLIVGNPDAEVSGAVICLDSTEAVIDEAIENKCNLVIAHHPIVFSGLKKITGKNYIERTVIKAIQNNIAIYAIHTNLDNVHNGVNAMICEKLGLVNCKVLSPKTGLLKKLFTFCPSEKADEVRNALFTAGAGHIGNYPECSYNTEGFGTFKAVEGADPYVGEIGEQHREPEIKIEVIFPAYQERKIVQALCQAHPYEEVAYDIIALENENNNVGSGMIGEYENSMDPQEFLNLLKERMKTACIRHTHLPDKKVKKIAVCGGSGSFLLNRAIAEQADFFVTADFKYHQFFDTDNKIVIADIGHYESEQFTIALLHKIVSKKFSNFAVRLTKINTNPINYY